MNVTLILMLLFTGDYMSRPVVYKIVKDIVI